MCFERKPFVSLVLYISISCINITLIYYTPYTRQKYDDILKVLFDT